MQRISRIHVSHFGSPTAWYDNHVFDLNDPDTDEPTDTVFNLENAGGKTSLLSYIFSCFEPKLDRWLQHLQKRNHRFHEYFSRDGRPSFILIEWHMPGRAANAPDYKLLIGQVVTIKDTVERSAEVDRSFFAFEVTDGLSLDDVPAPGLTDTPARSMPEFQQWMHEATSRSRGDFFRTKTQDDWVKHLANVRVLDMDLLRMQVDFNSNEGGMEEGFLTFNTEADLLRRFLILTLDPERSATVRDGLAQTADKLKARPRYEKQKAQLTKLHGVMLPFVDAAAEYEATQRDHDATRRTAASLAAALRGTGQEKSEAAEREQRYASAQDGAAEASERNAEHHLALSVAMKGLQLDRKVVVAEQAKNAAAEALADGETRLKMLYGAKALGHLTARIADASSLQALMELEEEGLKPAQQEAEIQGALLDGALAAAHADETRKAGAARDAERSAKSLLDGIQQDEQRANDALQVIAAERGQLEGFQAAYKTQREQLVAEGVLTPADTGSIAAAIERLALLETDLAAKVHALDEQLETLQDEEREHRGQAADQATKAAQALAAQGPLEQVLSVGYALRDELAQMEVMRTAADAELADSDEPLLLEQLDALLAAAEDEISDIDVLLAQLEHERNSIQETGLAGRNADVDAAVKQLVAVGVRSARAASAYVAEMLPDAAEATPVVLSDPARFLGVSVAHGDWETLQKRLPDLKVKLRAPVTVATQTLDAQATGVERLVLAPEDAALFNKSAAQAALLHLEQRYAATQDQRAAYAQRRNEGNLGRGKLLRYQREFGAARLRQADIDLDEKKAEEAAAKARQQELLEKAAASKSSAEQVALQRKPLPAAITRAEGGQRLLKAFQRDYEVPSAEKQRRLEQLGGLAQVQEDRLADLRAQREEIDVRRQNANVDLVRHEAAAARHGEDRTAIVYIDRKYPADQHLRTKPVSLESLRVTYARAVEVLRDLQANRDPQLAEKLKTAQAAMSAAELAFQDYASFDRDALQALLALDFEAEVRDQRAANERFTKAKNEAGDAHVALDTERKLYLRTHKQLMRLTPDVEDLDDAALETLVATTDQEAAAAADVAIRAREAAAAARSRAAQHESIAKQLGSLHSALTAAVASLTLDHDPLELPPDPDAYTHGLIEKHRDQKERVDTRREKARNLFQALSTAATSKDLMDVEAELARDIAESRFDLACADRLRVLALITDRMAAVQDTLDTMEPDLQNSVGELYNLTFEGMSMLTRACSKTMPLAAPYVGGKHIIKMKAKFQGISIEVRKAAIRKYFTELIDAGVVPAKGADLVARSLVAISGRQDLGIEVLKMEQNEAHQYQLASELKGSKGQGTVIAMFLYLLISQLRADTQATAKRAGGGPLILDNPFAKVQTRALIDAQRLLAKEIGVQLIFFTANADANILAGFRRVVRLRKSHMNSKSQRSHIETVSATFEDFTEMTA
jgi:hypothetical protein